MKKTHKLIGFLSTAAIMAGMVSPLLLDAAEYSTFAENTVAQKQISNLAMYRIVLSQDDCPTVGSPTVGQEAYYDIFNAKAIEKGYSGSLHYMQITGRGGNTEWALVEAPNNHGTSIYHLGFAREGQAGDVMNRIVTGTNFYTVYDTADMPLFENITADADGVKALKNTNLLIESWPFNYGGNAQGTLKDQDGNSVTMAGAHGGSFDWNDTPATNNNHGSYQYNIFDSNARTGQTFFDFNCLYRPHQNTVAGIGDADSFAGSYDWTSATDTILTDRSLQVYAMPNYLESDRIFNGQSANDSADWEAASSWLDGNGSIASAPTAGNDVFVNLGSVTLNTAAEINMLTVDPHGSLTITSGASLNVKGENYIDGKGAVTWIEGKLTSAGNFTAKDEVRLGTTASGAELILTGGTFNPKTLHIGYSANRSASATIDNTTVIAPQGFFLGNSGTGTADIRNSVITANTTVGNSGSGTLNLHNSTLSGNVTIANNQNSSGTMTVTGADTKIITCSNFNVGYKGNGTLNFYDGTIKTTGYFCIGNNQSYAEGTVNQYGGLIESVWVPLGHNGKGTWNMYGGKLLATNTGGMDEPNSTNNGLQIGDRATSNITFNLYDGTVESNGQMHVGRVGKGVLNQSGGQVVTGSNLLFGHIAGGDGTWNMTGGTANIGALLTIGYRGTGTANLSGDAQVSTKGEVYVGYDNTGSLTISENAVLTTASGKNITVGQNKTGTLTMTGGTINGGNDLIIARNNGAKGYAYISGDAKITTNSWIYVGTGNGSEGFMDISGNAVINASSSDHFIIGNDAGAVGTVNISENANVNVTNTFYIGKNGTGTLNQTGGTITAKTLAVGDNGTGTYNIYDGSVSTKEWLLAGFNKGSGVINQYGGNVNANWLTLGWEVAASNGTYNMYGGTLTANGVGNPAIIARNGVGTFNLYDGDVTLKTATSTNQGDANKDKFVGYSLKIGAYDGAAAQMNIHAADITAGGKVSMNAKSELNFETSVKGLGTLTVEGAFEQNGGKVSVAHNDAISFTDDYSLENGKDIMTVGGKTAVTVTNDSANILETAYDTATGKLNVQFKDDAYVGSLGGNSALSLDPATVGWVSMEDFNTSNPYVLELLVNTNGMEIDAFVDILNAELNPSEEELWAVAEVTENDSVSMTFMPNTLTEMDVLSWDFSNSVLYGLQGVAVVGINGNEVPEPSAWVLLVLGCGILGWMRNRKKA